MPADARATAIPAEGPVEHRREPAGPVGMIGTGNMGGRICRRLLDCGVPVLGYDRSAAQLRRFDIPAARSVTDLVTGCEQVLLSLPDSAAVEAVVHQPGGLLASCRPGQTVLDLSTASPRSSREIHAAFHAQGVDFLDGGVSGGAAAAEQGTLTIMVGGPPEALTRLRAVLDHVSSRVYHMGQSGSGHTAKLLNNFLNGVSLAATAEVMVAARRAGLDLHQLLEVINHSSGVNFASLHRFPHIIQGDYLQGGLTGALMEKDIELYVQLLRELEVPSLNAHGCQTTFQISNRLGYADQISNRVVDALGDLAGGIRVQPDPEPPSGTGQ